MAGEIRAADAIAAVKLETVSGTDAFGGAAPDPAVDFLNGSITMNLSPEQIQNPEQTGSRDRAPPILGALGGDFTLTCLLRGSGTPEVPAKWMRLLRISSWEEKLQAAAIGAPTAAEAGTATTATLPAALFNGGADAYQGMPLLVGGAGVPFPITGIIGNTAARVATLGHSYSPVLGTGNTVQVPKHARYAPHSDETKDRTATVYVYQGGLRHRFTGVAGGWSLRMPTGQPGQVTFQLSGQYQGSDAAATPAGIVLDKVSPPIFRDGICRLNRKLCRVSNLTVNSGVTFDQPPNPEAPQGRDPSLVGDRLVTADLDPLATVQETLDVLAALKGGEAQTFVAATDDSAPAGNRFMFVIPAVSYTGFSQQNVGRLLGNRIPVAAYGQNQGCFIVQF